MIKKILSVLLAALMLFAFATSCNRKPEKDTSSKKKKPTSSQVSDVESTDDVSSSTMAEVESKDESDDSSYHPYEWELKTKSAFFRDTDEAKQSVSVSSSLKVYKNPNTPGLGCFHFNTGTCEAYGTDTESKFREFTQVVEAGYFNTYLLGAGTNLIRAAKIVAENGGTIWLSAGRFDSKSSTIEVWGENQKYYLDLLKKEGLYDLVNGYYWDEPIWHGQTNDDFLTQSEYIYKNFGLRNFPVFACGEFSGSEGNPSIGVEADQMRKLAPYACKYITDAAYDSYSVDVRDGAPNANKYAEWTNAVGGKPITDGKSYYVQYKNHLKELINHPVNYWYYPTAYKTYLWGGLKGLQYADEDFCIAHVEFMAEDVLKEEYAGGLILYTYYDYHGKYTGFASHCDVKDKDGNYLIYPDAEKWPNYCNTLRETTKKFNTVKVKKAIDLGL